MKYYNLIKLNRYFKSHRIKFLGLYVLHLFRRRYLALHFDPVNACNLRCKMCYFTDKDYVKKLKGIFPEDDLDWFGESFFKRAVKLQIGCGTEPTLYKNITRIIETATKHQVPYISMTTNANLIEKDKLEAWTKAGLSEITVSLHGVTRESYEDFMGKGDFDKFMNALKLISDVKKKHNLILRINYTFNEDNFKELDKFYDIFDAIAVDVLQIRPISKLGNTAYNNFSLEGVLPHYETIHKKLKTISLARGVQFLSHNPFQLQNRRSVHSVIKKYVYCYISPTSLYKDDFLWKEETYDEYAKRTNLSAKILKDMCSSKEKVLEYADDKLNYSIN